MSDVKIFNEVRSEILGTNLVSMNKNILNIIDYNPERDKPIIIKAIDKYLRENIYYFKVYFPQYNFQTTSDQEIIAAMTHMPALVYLNPEKIFENFYNPQNIFIIKNILRMSIETAFYTLSGGLVWHEVGHTLITLPAEQAKAYYNKMTPKFPYTFFHFVINVVDDTMLQDYMMDWDYNSRDGLELLSILGQGYNSYYEFLNNQNSSIRNILYYLILYSYKDYHLNIFKPFYNHFVIPNIMTPNDYTLIDTESFWTTKLLKKFSVIKTIRDINEKLEAIFKFADELYDLLKNNKNVDEELKQQINSGKSEDTENKSGSGLSDQEKKQELDKQIENIINEINKKSNLGQQVSKQLKNSVGYSKLPHAQLKDDISKDIPSTNFKKIATDSLRNLVINSDVGLKRNLKTGSIDPTNIPYSSIKSNIMYRNDEDINLPDLAIFSLLDASGSMSNNIDGKISFYNYIASLIVGYQSAFVNTFPTTKCVNYTFDTKVIYVGDNLNTNYNPTKMLQLFHNSFSGGGTNPDLALKEIIFKVDQIQTKEKILILISDGEFNDSDETTNYIKILEQKFDLILVINLTGGEFKSFKGNNTIKLNYGINNIGKLFNDLASKIQAKFLLKGGD